MMKKKERELLVKDLLGRLPYGLKVETYWNFADKKKKTFPIVTFTHDMLGYYIGDDGWKFNVHYLPFLRPMESMTEEEEQYALDTWGIDMFNNGIDFLYDNYMSFSDASAFVEWLNEKKFDYRGLIPMELALEAPEGMYK